MPRALKVYGYRGWMPSVGHVRQVVAARSQREASGLFGCTAHELRRWGSETANEEEVTIAMSRPGTVFSRRDDTPIWRSSDGFRYRVRIITSLKLLCLGDEAEAGRTPGGEKSHRVT